MNSDIKICKELIDKQLPDVPTESKLSIKDIVRISKFLNRSIFDEKECSIWQGYIIKQYREYVHPFINIYFKHKKVNLHRLLFINYKDSLRKDEYIKFTCANPGRCCNLNHIIKFKYCPYRNGELMNTRGDSSTHKETKKYENNKKNVEIAHKPQTLYFD